MRTQCLLLALCGGVLAQSLVGQPTSPPTELNLVVSNQNKWVSWPRPTIPAWEVNRLAVTTNFSNWTTIPSNSILVSPSGYVYRALTTLPQQFYHLTLEQMTSNDLVAAQVLNRLAYGPTPDDLDRVRSIGPQAYMNEQLAPETLASTVDAYTSVQTNAVSLPPNTNWTIVTVTGLVTSSTLYMYLQRAGEVYIDDVQLYLLRNVTNQTVTTNGMGQPVTNTVVTVEQDGTNVLVNGNFEQPLAVGWAKTGLHQGSDVSTTFVCEGTQSCRLVASGNGVGTGTNSVSQLIVPALPNNRRCMLRFAYLQNSNSRNLTFRLSGSGLIISGTDEPDPPEWIYATATGRATSSPFLYIYLSQAGEGWVDDIKLVQGTVAEAGANLLQNGGFDSTLGPWQALNNHSTSVIDTTVARSGTGSLRLVATGAGSGNSFNGNSVVQQVPVANNQIYTVSYWYRPATRGRTLTVRLSGSLLNSVPDSSPSGVRRRLDAAAWGPSRAELRSWFCHNAIASPRQLLEVLSQFFENHFVTYYSKTADYFDGFYPNDGTDTEGRIATDLEYREMSRWRQALLNPNCTFYDLLKIHVESPAQIIYLDTVGSRGDGNNVANENYARELFELFAMGVDNGYDQNDIVAMSRAWTGWTVDIVEPGQENNPFAPRSQIYGRLPGIGYNNVSNIVGVWSFVFNAGRHGTNRAPILSVWDPNSSATDPRAIGPKTVPGRFGPPWAGRSYQLVIPRRTGTAGLQDGYDVIRHLAQGPACIFTAEYISIKLCRIFIHDRFPNPTTHSDLPEYDFYNYADPNRTAEAELIRQCIVAWDTPGPDGRKGHLRAVLRTIFDSELFRSHAGSRQKVKTPLEFVVSALRSMRSVDAGGQVTIGTDGNFDNQLSRMGGMSLFNRADPDGYPEDGASWVSAGTLAERLRYVQSLCTNPNASNPARPSDAGAHTTDPVTLLQRKLPQASLKNPYHVADFFVRLIFFGEGTANLDLYRDAAVRFLNDGSADFPPGAGQPDTRTLVFADPSIPVSGAANSAYDTRVRGLVSFLMTTQRFQEQ